MYLFEKLIGEGSSGKVFLTTKKPALDTTNQGQNDPQVQHVHEKFAIKILDKASLMNSIEAIKLLISEVKVHWALNECESIVRLIETYEDDTFIYLVLEYQEEGSLLNEIFKSRRFDEENTKTIMEQLLLSIDFIHQKGVVHRDIKLENILIHKIEDDGKQYEVKIADFGIAEFLPKTLDIEFGDNMLHTQCGSPGYIAPEILRH